MQITKQIILNRYYFHRSSKSNVYSNRAIPPLPPGRSGAVLHKGQPSPPVRDLDEGQAAAGALPDQGHRHHEQRLLAVHQGQPESSGSIYLYSL